MCSFQKYTKGLAFILPSFAGVCIFWLIPYVDVIRRSFWGAVNGEFVGIENYRTIFANKAKRFVWQQATHFGSSECVCRCWCSVSDHSSPACRAEKDFTQILKSFFSSANGNPCSISGTSVETAV